MFRTLRVVGPVLLWLATAPVAVAQTTVYHLHAEASSTANRRQLTTAGPDAAAVPIQTANLKNKAIGEKLIAAFDTPAGVPGIAGLIPAGSTLTFQLWMKKTADVGTLFPRAKVFLNGPSGIALCTATGTTAITTTLTTYTIACDTTANVTLAATSRFYLWAGADMTAGSTTTTFMAELDVEGTLNGNVDSQVAIPNTLPPPAITAPIVPSSGPVGPSVTIDGTNFGATQGSSAVKFFNNKTAAPTSWSATRITAPVPAGATTGNVTVTVAGNVSNGVSFTVLPTPTITTLSPGFGAVGTLVTITGTKFGSTQDTSTVTFAGTVATAFTSWSATRIKVKVPAGATTGPVVVTVNGVSSAGTAFTVTPILTSVAPSTGRVGDAVTIAGVNFGAAQGASAVTFNGTTATATSWSDTTIGVTVPTAASTGPIVVTVGGAASNGITFTVTAAPSPSITSLTPSTGHFADPVTIGGANFGSSQGSSTVTFNGTQATITGWNDNSITTSVPGGAATGPVVVSVSNEASNGVTFVVDRGTGSGLLEITSPENGAVMAPGETLTVTVSSPDNSTFVGVFVIAQNPIDDTGDGVDTLPAQFSLTIPPDAECRKYVVHALGTTWTGQPVDASIEIDVERPDMPTAVFPQLRQIVFQAEGEEASIDLSARFGDGSVLSVRRSTNVTYASSDPNVATVDANGIVTAVAEGDAEIVATYGAPEAGIYARIPVSVPASLLAAAPQSIDFGNQAVGTTSTRQMTVTNMSDDTLSITEVTVTGDYSETENCVASSPLAPGASCSISVTFGPTAAGPRPGAVGIKSSVHIVPVAFSLTGTGVSQ